MGVVSSMRRRRHEKKAAYKAARVQAKQTAKALAKKERAREKYLQKTAAKIRSLDAKAAQQQSKRDVETAKALVAQAKSHRITAGKALGWVGAARVIIPVAAPLVYRALATLGTSGGPASPLLNAFGAENISRTTTGPHAVQHARISDLRNRAGARNVPDSVRAEITRKLATLETTLDSASGGGSSQERSAAAVSAELDRLDSQLTDAIH